MRYLYAGVVVWACIASAHSQEVVTPTMHITLINQPDDNTYSLECPRGPSKLAGTKNSRTTLLSAINGLALLDHLSQEMQVRGTPPAKIDKFRAEQFDAMTKQTGCVFKSSGKAPVVAPKSDDDDKGFHNGGGGGNDQHEEL